jgi:hypothetical protein
MHAFEDSSATADLVIRDQQVQKATSVPDLQEFGSMNSYINHNA